MSRKLPDVASAKRTDDTYASGANEGVRCIAP